MPDIFISYSRKDSTQALQLAERLRSEGMSVWIDQIGIEAATSWSKEIVQAIKESKVLILLLSRHSLASHNVIKELSIAGEQRKIIVPVEIERVQLTDDFEYHLAGIQRVSIHDTDAIHRVVARHVGAEGTAGTTHSAAAHPPKPMRRSRTAIAVLGVLLAVIAGGLYWYLSGKSQALDQHTIVVLPFSDLSAQPDSDKLSISFSYDLRESLESEKRLQVIPRSVTMELAKTELEADEIAQQLGARYAAEGSVLSLGDSLFVEVKLRDCIAMNDVFRKKYAGVLHDVFELHTAVSHDIHSVLVKPAQR